MPINNTQKKIYMSASIRTYEMDEFPINARFINYFIKPVMYTNLNDIGKKYIIWWMAHRMILQSNLYFYDLYNQKTCDVTTTAAILVNFFLFICYDVEFLFVCDINFFVCLI